MQIYQSGWKGWKYMVRNRYMNIDKADKMDEIKKMMVKHGYSSGWKCMKSDEREWNR